MKSFWKKKLPSLLLSVLMLTSLFPTALAASADVVYEVLPGRSIMFDAADFSALKSFDYLEFTDDSKLDDYGYFTAYDKDGDKVTLESADLDNLWFYYNENYIEYDSDCDLDTLTFVADSNARGTLSLEFKLWKGKDRVYTGVLEIKIGNGSSTGTAAVSYRVSGGNKVTFDAADFSALKSFDYLEFTSYSKLDDYGYFNAYDRDGDKVALDEADLDNLWFYYNENNIEYDSDCDLDTLTFVANANARGTLSLEFKLWKGTTCVYTGVLEIRVGDGDSSSSADGDIVYTMDEDDAIAFDEDDFKKFFQASQSGTFSYIRFTEITNLDECGVLTTYSYNDRSNEFVPANLDEDDALDGYFFYDDDDVTDTTDYYCLDGLGFESDKNANGEVVVLEFTAFGTSSNKKVSGSLVIEIGDVKDSSSSKADIEYEAEPGEEVVFDEEDFNEFFQKTYSNYDFEYLYFTDSENLGSSNGYIYYKYDRSSEVRFSASSLEDAYFYYDEDYMPAEDDCYPLEDLSFVASESFDTAVTLDFTAYYSNSKQVKGTVTISPKEKETTNVPQASGVSANILYTTTPGAAVQLKSNDFARFYESNISNSTFQSVKLLGVPSIGGLYYNYYNASTYGTAARLQLTAHNCGNQPLYPSPANTTQYALTELTYIPASGNYTASIPFAASGSGGYTVYGSVMISVTTKAIPEIYGVTPKNAAVSFPAPSISTAVSSGTGVTLSGIQLLKLPAANVGTIYVGSGTARKATTSDLYGVSGSSWTISQLRFVPASNYTGNVEIPYLAYSSNGTTIGVGTFSLGVVSSQPKFSDVNSSTWCYKYVAELSDAKIISGYSNGTFKPNNTITYGAALKLIMLAAGYPEQAPTVAGSAFSGYLAKAQSEGIVTRSNVNLSAPITRLQVAQLAAGAMKLDLNNLSSVKPFTDTTDKHVQALNAAGIVEGYFSGGTSTYKPNNTLTRGQVSAIVWRMQNYQ